MAAIVFVVFMAFLILINKERWWLYCFLIMGMAVQCGYQVGIIGIAVWIGVLKVLKDIFSAVNQA